MSKSWLANHITFWVDKDIDLAKLEMNNPEYRTIKHYIEEDAREFYLTSPLLEGDRLEVINGDLYHYHKMGHVVLNGSADLWSFNVDITAPDEDNNIPRYNFYSGIIAHLIKHYDAARPLINNFGYCGAKYHDEGIRMGSTNNITLIINQDKLSPFITVENPNSIHKANALKKWLSINPIDVVYELANPHYELIQEKFDLIDLEKDNYFSIDGSTISINCQFDLCTIKPKYLYANTLYKVSFDANKAGEISIDLGGTLSPMTIVEGHNKIVLTTPTTLSHALLKVNGSTDIVIDNLMIIDSDKDFDSFEGINNTFDEMPVKNICSERTSSYIVGTDTNGEAPKIDLNESIDKGELVTVIGKLPSKKNLAKVVEGSESTMGNNSEGATPVTIKVENGILKFSGINKHYKTYNLATGEFIPFGTPYINETVIDYYKDLKAFDVLDGTYTLSCRLKRKEVAPDLIGENHEVNHSFITVGVVYDNEYMAKLNYTCSEVMNNTDILEGKSIHISSHVNGIYVAIWYNELHDCNDMELQIQLETGNKYTKFEPYTDAIIDKPIAINLYNDTGKATGKNLFNPNALYADDYCIEDERNCFKWRNSNGYAYYQNKSLIHKPIDASKGIYVAVEIKATVSGFYPGILYVFEDGTQASEEYWGRGISTEYFEKVTFKLSPRDKIIKSIQCFSYDPMNFFYLDIDKTQIEIGTEGTDYEPFRDYVNNEPIEIAPDENGNFCVQMNADRDYANKVALYVPNEENYNDGDKIKVNDLMVFKGDFDDVYIPDWIDTDETNYLVEFKAFNNQFGFGKNKLI
jgi:hypothetical protein